MKFIIGKGNKKRVIETPFGICASREDFIKLRNEITHWLNDFGNGQGLSYGWVYVIEPQSVDAGPTNTHPEPWDEDEQTQTQDTRYECR